MQFTSTQAKVAGGFATTALALVLSRSNVMETLLGSMDIVEYLEVLLVLLGVPLFMFMLKPKAGLSEACQAKQKGMLNVDEAAPSAMSSREEEAADCKQINRSSQSKTAAKQNEVLDVAATMPVGSSVQPTDCNHVAESNLEEETIQDETKEKINKDDEEKQQPAVPSDLMVTSDVLEKDGAAREEEDKDEVEEKEDEDEAHDALAELKKVSLSTACWADVEEDDNLFWLKSEERAKAVETPEEVAAIVSGDSSGAVSTPAPRADDRSRHIAAIRAFGQTKNLPGARAAFEQALKSGAPLNTQLQNALLAAYSHCDDAVAATELLEKMKAAKQADVVSFNVMLRAWLSAGQRNRAEAVLREMAAYGVTANKVTFNELLSDRVSAGDRRGAWKIVEKMLSVGLGMNKIACAILLKALNANSSTDEVKKTLDLLDTLDEPADEILCSSAIEACLRMKNLELLSDLMARFRESGLGGTSKAGAALSSATYGSMIKAYGQARDLERVWATWREMLANDVVPKDITLGCMIESLVINGATDEAWGLVHEMQSSNTVIYSTVLKGFARAGQPQRAFDVYEEMCTRNIERSTITFNSLLDACVKCGVMDRVPQVFEDMKSSGVEPDVITYSTLIKGFCIAGDLDCAFNLLDEMKADGKCVPDEIVYNSLLDGCSRHQQTEKALQLLEEMKTAGVTPSNYTLSILVKLLGRTRMLKRAFTMVEEFRTNYGVRPNVQVYTCLMQACLMNRQMDRALAVHDDMVNDIGCQPDEKAYSVLLGGCLKAWAVEEAVRVARCAYRLPGHGLAEPTVMRGRPSGVEFKLLSDLAAKLKSSNPEPQLLQDFQEVQEAAGHRDYHGSSSYNYGGSSSGGASKGKGKGKSNGGKGGGKGSSKNGGSARGSKGSW